MGSTERKIRAWFYIVLLLAERMVAVRTAAGIDRLLEDSTGTDVAPPREQAADAVAPAAVSASSEPSSFAEDFEVSTSAGRSNTNWFFRRYRRLKALRKALKKGVEAEQKLTCFTIVNHLIKHIKAAGPMLMKEGEKHDFDQALILQEVMISFVAAADRRKCLAEVMADSRLQAELRTFLDMVPAFLRSPLTEVGRNRFKEAYLQLVSFQQSSLKLSENLTDQQLLMGADIRNGFPGQHSYTDEDCPRPCQKCDHHETNGFGFRCLLKRADRDTLPDVDGIECDKPQRRWFRWYPYSITCRSDDFLESAVLHAHLSSMLSCAATTILMGLNGDLSEARRLDMHRICVKVEQGRSVEKVEEHQYTEQLRVFDRVLAAKDKARFGVMIVLGMASGLAALRQAARGNERPSYDTALLETANVVPTDEYAGQCEKLAKDLSNFTSLETMQEGGWALTNIDSSMSEYGDDFKGKCESDAACHASLETTLKGSGRLRIAVGNNWTEGSHKFLEVFLNGEQLDLLQPLKDPSSKSPPPIMVEFDYKEGDVFSITGVNGGMVAFAVSCTAEPEIFCDEEAWPDVAGQACGKCKVLVNRFEDYGTCENYCAEVGRQCVAAWEDLSNGCDIESEKTCDQTWDTSDAICECGYAKVDDSGALQAQEATPETFLAPFSDHLIGQHLSIREQDFKMYSDQNLVQRDPLMDELESECARVYAVKKQNTFAEGTKSLAALGLVIKNNEDEGWTVKPCGKDCHPLKLLYGGLIGTAWVSVMAYVFVPIGLGLNALLSPLYFGLLWIPLLLSGLKTIYVLTGLLGDIFSSSHRSKMKAHNVLACRNETILKEGGYAPK